MVLSAPSGSGAQEGGNVGGWKTFVPGSGRIDRSWGLFGIAARQKEENFLDLDGDDIYETDG